MQSINEIVTLFLKDKIDSLSRREEELKAQLDTKLRSIKEEQFAIIKLMQETCMHSETVVKASWDYHNNVDDSHSECKICGKYL